MLTTPPPKRHPYAQWSPDARALDLVGDKWTLLIVRDLASGPRRFTELQRVLPGISIEQLRSRLGRMVAAGILTRRPHETIAPRVDYELTERGRQLLLVVGELARWGYRWAWGSPREAERIDIGAIMRTAPGLMRPPADVAAVVELAVDADGAASYYTLTITGGTVAIAEGRATKPDACVSGSQDDWIAALEPGADRAGLCIAGDDEVASMLLALVSPS